jgi:hypothetical protein
MLEQIFTEVAFFHNRGLGVKFGRIVRANPGAKLTANAMLRLVQNQTQVAVARIGQCGTII